MKSLDKLRSCFDNHAILNTVTAKKVVRELADEIEKEVGENYFELPTDSNGDRITYDTMIEQWGALESIYCILKPSGTPTWFVRGHDISAPTLRADEVTICKPTALDVLCEALSEAVGQYVSEGHCTESEIVSIANRFESRLQLKEEQELNAS